MTEQNIQCPNCQYEIPLTEALSKQLRQQMQAELDARAKEQEARLMREKEALDKRAKTLEEQQAALDERIKERVQQETERLNAEARQRAEEEYGVKLKAQAEELAEKRQKIEQFRQQEVELEKQREQLRDEKSQLELAKLKQAEAIREELEERFRKEHETRIQQEREAATRQARDQFEQHQQALQEENAAQKEQLKTMREQELALRKEKQALEMAREEMELEVQRKLDEERKTLTDAAKKMAAEEQQLRMREKDDLIGRLKDQLGEAQRRIEQGSQERQGEALEEELIDLLKQTFPFDVFEDVKRGARGADVLQTVKNSMGKVCGRILWESKNAKDFQKAWLTKLKSDRQEAGADIGVLVSITLPDEVGPFGMMDELWVTSFPSAMNLCVALRQTLILVEREKTVNQHAGSLKDVIYQYVTGQEFATRVKMIASAYASMLSDLESEKRSMQRIWKKRETQIRLVLDNISGMQGELEGMVGSQAALPAMPELQLEGIVEDEDENETESAEDED